MSEKLKKTKAHNYKYNVIMYLCYNSHEQFPQHSTLLWDVCNICF